MTSAGTVIKLVLTRTTSFSSTSGSSSLFAFEIGFEVAPAVLFGKLSAGCTVGAKGFGWAVVDRDCPQTANAPMQITMNMKEEATSLFIELCLLHRHSEGGAYRERIENFDLIVCFWKKPLKGITSQLSDQFEETFGIFSPAI